MASATLQRAIALHLQAGEAKTAGDLERAANLLEMAISVYARAQDTDMKVLERAQAQLAELRAAPKYVVPVEKTLAASPLPVAPETKAESFSSTPSAPIQTPVPSGLTAAEHLPAVSSTLESGKPKAPEVSATATVSAAPEAALGEARTRLLLLERFLIPLDTLELLHGDGSSAVRRAAALHRNALPQYMDLLRRAARTDPTLEPSDLARLSRGGAHARALAARHPRTPTADLERLADLGCAADLVANPSTPPAVLERLSLNHAHWKALVRNPATPEAVVKSIRKTVREEDEDAVLASLARNPRLTPKMLLQLAERESWEVREAVCEHAKLTPEIVDVLAGDRWNADIREAVARHPHAAPSTLERLSADGDDDVRLGVAANVNAPDAALERLATDRVVAVRALVAANLSTSQALLDMLAEDPDALVRRIVEARGDGGDRTALERLSTERSLAARLLAAAHPRTLPMTLERLAASREEVLRAHVAANPSTPPVLVERLRPDRAWAVRAIAEMRANLEAGDATVRVTPDARLRRIIAASAVIAVQRLQQLGNDPSRAVRLAVAANPRTPPQVLEAMLGDEALRAVATRNPAADDSVRAALGTIEATEAEMERQNLLRLRRLARSGNEHTRERVARNLSVPPDLLETLAADNSALVRDAVLRHPKLSAKTLDYFARYPAPAVRVKVAARPDTAPATLLLLAGDADPTVRDRVLQRQDLNEAMLLSLAEDTRVYTRRAVAQHDAVTTRVLRRLIAYRSRELDLIVIAHERADAGLLVELETRYERDPTVCVALLAQGRLPSGAVERIAVRAARRLAQPSRWGWLRWATTRLIGNQDAWTPVLSAALARPDLTAAGLVAIVATSQNDLRPRVRAHPNANRTVQRALRRAAQVNP